MPAANSGEVDLEIPCRASPHPSQEAHTRMSFHLEKQTFVAFNLEDERWNQARFLGNLRINMEPCLDPFVSTLEALHYAHL